MGYFHNPLSTGGAKVNQKNYELWKFSMFLASFYTDVVQPIYHCIVVKNNDSSWNNFIFSVFQSHFSVISFEKLYFTP